MGNDVGSATIIHKENAECEICHNELWVNIDFEDATICESCLREAHKKKEHIVNGHVKALYGITRENKMTIRLIVEINKDLTSNEFEYKLGQKVKFVVDEDTVDLSVFKEG